MSWVRKTGQEFLRARGTAAARPPRASPREALLIHQLEWATPQNCRHHQVGDYIQPTQHWHLMQLTAWIDRGYTRSIHAVGYRGALRLQHKVRLDAGDGDDPGDRLAHHDPLPTQRRDRMVPRGARARRVRRLAFA